MASPPVATKSSSRWGSFLQQAVAGVESRLDTILADDDSPAARQPRGDTKTMEQQTKRDKTPLPANPQVNGVTRTASISKNHDRLQERLAKAMVNRNATGKGDAFASTPPFSLPSRTTSPANVPSSRASSELFSVRGETEHTGHTKPSLDIGDGPLTAHKVNGNIEVNASATPFTFTMRNQMPCISNETPIDNIPRKPSGSTVVTAQSAISEVDQKLPEVPTKPLSGYELAIQQMRSENEAAEIRRQEENHLQLERIDALQAKLQYLTKEAASIAKKAASEAQPGSMEQKLAVKDEKIALLMEEGQKLSKTELKHMNIIKKLRANSVEEEKRVLEFKKLADKHETAAREASERAKQAEIADRRASEKAKDQQNIEIEFEALRADRDAQTSLIQDLQRQLSENTDRAYAAEVRTHTETLEGERKINSTLRDEVSKLKLERERIEEIHRTETRELRDRSEREKERAKASEISLRGEQSVLERRLEILRARAEEVSTGTTGDSQTKLLRQVETLQNQYSVASENWQGIEGSLLARITALEGEKDEIAKREVEVRRKARETTLKSRRAEKELEKNAYTIRDLERDKEEQKAALKVLSERVHESERDLMDAQSTIKAERIAWQARQTQYQEDDRFRPASRTPNTTHEPFQTESPVALYYKSKSSHRELTPEVNQAYFPNDSPVPAHRRSRKSSVERVSPHSRRLQTLPSLTASTTHVPTERPRSRRTSRPRMHPSGLAIPSRQGSVSSIPQFVANHGNHSTYNGSIAETSSTHHNENQDDFFDGVHTPATPELAIHDMISTSTAAAGPSVQLVERMSAAVRRLESEKAATEEELRELAAQKEELREQVIGLMNEVEEKRGFEEKVKILEKECAELRGRYETTLEMLGEKSEKVGELEADVADLKGMYRELVERTMK